MAPLCLIAAKDSAAWEVPARATVTRFMTELETNPRTPRTEPQTPIVTSMDPRPRYSYHSTASAGSSRTQPSVSTRAAAVMAPG